MYNAAPHNIFPQYLVVHRGLPGEEAARAPLEGPCLLYNEESEKSDSESPTTDDDMDTCEVAGPNDFPPPCPCSFLSVGQNFSGRQRLSSKSVGRAPMEEDWRVHVHIQVCDLAAGYVCGMMEAVDVPKAKSPIVTFWEGHIIDNVNHTFFTNGWDATKDTDIKHWRTFPAFQALQPQVVNRGGRSSCLSEYPFIFMRWKEQCFVNVGNDCGLSIAGFYYICMNRVDGTTTGYYFDPNSSPFQELELNPAKKGGSGFTFGSYSLR